MGTTVPRIRYLSSAETPNGERRGLGWKPDLPDHRDRLYTDRPQLMKAGEELKAVVDLFPHQSKVRNQGNEGSCVGHGVSSGVDYLRRVDKDHHSTIYSPRWAYYFARFLEGPEWAQQDGGAYIRFGVKGAAQEGICPESNWKYTAGQFMKKPTASAAKAAARWKLEYLACRDLPSILSALNNGHVVVGGFMCHSGMWTPAIDASGDLPMPGPRDRQDGGHCVLFVGYDQARRVLLFKNSWGEGWGNGFGHKGYGTLPYDFVTRGLADDFWAMIKEAA